MAKKITEWESSIDGKDYKFAYQKVKGRHILEFNGEKVTLKGGAKSFFLGFDEPFNLDGKEARLVINSKKPDIVVDGVLLQSGETYVPAPVWSVVFIILCGLLPIISLGGLIPAVLGIGGATICGAVAKASMPGFLRVLICLLITLVVWIIAIVVLGVFAVIF